jgi:peptidoglycan/LPS O-acetylase OafA/YrhL
MRLSDAPGQYEEKLSMSRIVRQSHRWIGILFIGTVIANFVAMVFGEPHAAITYAPLFPLTLMMLSGLYLFALPYSEKRASRGQIE